jgi:hypothetical protein
MKIEDLTARQIQALAKSHISGFENMIGSDDPTVRLDECRMYLAIWQSVLKKVQTPDFLSMFSEDERGEIQDALDSGDYEDILRRGRYP